MSLYRGVIPIFKDVTQGSDEGKKDPFVFALDIITQQANLPKGATVTITCGDISGEGGLTHTLKILTV